jgi:hypothetical protein
MMNTPPLLNAESFMVGLETAVGIEVGIVRGYQRRTQKGTGRTEKTVLTGAAKNPRSLKACNITRKRDMGEFFFISIADEIVVNIFTTQRNYNFRDLGD